MSGIFTDHAALRGHYPRPLERSVLKTLPRLDHHMKRFIALSPFLCIGRAANQGRMSLLEETAQALSACSTMMPRC